MRIPESLMDRHGNVSLFYERIEPAYFAQERVGDFELKLFYELPRDSFTYGCSPPDVLKVLRAAAPSIPGLPDMLAFRQPTRKQRQLMPVWGRFLYVAEFGAHEGTAIVLEAQEIGAPISRSKRTSLDDQAEIERLRADGHVFNETKRTFDALLSEQSVRSTILFRTLLHEIGHWVQYHEDVLDAATALDSDHDIAQELHFSKPTSELEVYAHSFADRLAADLRSNGTIPFEPLTFELSR